MLHAGRSTPDPSRVLFAYFISENKTNFSAFCSISYTIESFVFTCNLCSFQEFFTPCGLSRRAGFNSLPPGPGPRSRIPSFSFPVLSCILQGPSPYIAAAVVTKGTGTRHTPAATVTAAEHPPSSNDNSMTSDTLLRKKNLKGRVHLKADNNTSSQCSALFLQARDGNGLI